MENIHDWIRIECICFHSEIQLDGDFAFAARVFFNGVDARITRTRKSNKQTSGFFSLSKISSISLYQSIKVQSLLRRTIFQFSIVYFSHKYSQINRNGERERREQNKEWKLSWSSSKRSRKRIKLHQNGKGEQDKLVCEWVFEANERVSEYVILCLLQATNMNWKLCKQNQREREEKMKDNTHRTQSKCSCGWFNSTNGMCIVF